MSGTTVREAPYAGCIPAHVLSLRLLAPHDTAVVDAIRGRLASRPGPAITVVVDGNLVSFTGSKMDDLRQRVGLALVQELGPAGWYDYFRPVAVR